MQLGLEQKKQAILRMAKRIETGSYQEKTFWVEDAKTYLTMTKPFKLFGLLKNNQWHWVPHKANENHKEFIEFIKREKSDDLIPKGKKYSYFIRNNQLYVLTEINEISHKYLLSVISLPELFKKYEDFLIESLTDLKFTCSKEGGRKQQGLHMAKIDLGDFDCYLYFKDYAFYKHAKLILLIISFLSIASSILLSLSIYLVYGLKSDNTELAENIAKATERIEDQKTALLNLAEDAMNAKEEADATSSKLEKINKELEDKNEELNRFTYIASHDLKEPLRAIGSYTTLLRKKLENTEDEKIKKYSQAIVEGVKRMNELITDLLALSRISKQDFEKESIDLNSLIQDTRKSLAGLIQENEAELIAKDLPTIQANKTHMIQIFQNLIQNAIKFRRKDQKPIVEIKAEAWEDNGKDFWKFSIKDNGIGIEEKYFKKIFDAFGRLHGRNEYEGTGIGLATCKKIAENHGGRIWLESELEKGSCFFFTIEK